MDADGQHNLNCIAGLLGLSGGSIWLDQTRIDTLPPEKRGFGMVFQKGNSLRGCVNKALGRLWANGTIKKLQNTYLARAGAPDIK